MRVASPEGAEEEFDFEVGSWFSSYGRFASDLLMLQSSKKKLPKLVVIQAPSRALVSSALNIGFSAQALFAAEQSEKRVSVDELSSFEAGALVQIRFQWQQEDKKSDKTRRVVTGSLKSFLPAKPGARFPSLVLDVGAKLESISLSNYVSSIFSMPQETPRGQEVQTAPALGVNLERWGAFLSQQRPSACTFSYLSDFEKEASLEVRDHLLLNQYLQVPGLSIKNLSRLDRLTEDEYTHFVNGYETLRSFQKMEDEIAALVEPFEFVILDGNAAVANLVGNSLLRQKSKICVLDGGNHERLSDAIVAIGSEAMYLERPEGLAACPTIDQAFGLFAELWY